MSETYEQPYQVARDTWVIPHVFPVPAAGSLFVNSMVIAGREPIVVDTGSPLVRDHWLEQAWSIVDPADVRWVFISHDDSDHAGNVADVAAACPAATFVASWLTFGHLQLGGVLLPPERCLIVGDGDRVTAGDRTLVVLRPPIYDSPGTRGLFDTASQVLWASDAFGGFMPAPAEDAADLPRTDWEDGVAALSRLLCPWLVLVDDASYQATVDRVASLTPAAIATCHGPTVRDGGIEPALRLVRRLPAMPPWFGPTQAEVEQAMAAILACAHS
jgi:flavorubredoxin